LNWCGVVMGAVCRRVKLIERSGTGYNVQIRKFRALDLEGWITMAVLLNNIMVVRQRAVGLGKRVKPYDRTPPATWGNRGTQATG
jgi:hypothetical protein